MRAQNGWALEAVQELFCAIYDGFPEFKHRLRCEISGGDGNGYVYFRTTSPPAVLRYVTPHFFAKRDLRLMAWTPVFRQFGRDTWELFNERSPEHMALGNVDFGWCHRDPVLPREESRIVSHFPLVMTGSPPHGPAEIAKTDESPERPAFLRKVMD